MNTSSQTEFTNSVHKYYENFTSFLRLEKPLFSMKGFLSTAKMIANGGIVEILCGPPEYHAELFIECAGTNIRLGLAELFKFESLKHWLNSYQSKTGSQSDVDADVEWIFHLLSEGLKGIRELAWIQR